MKAHITDGGELHVQAETNTEAYALNQWLIHYSPNGEGESVLVINRNISKSHKGNIQLGGIPRKWEE